MDYAHPETLVSTEWVAQHLADPSVRIVEVDVDTKAYEGGHIPGAISWDWTTRNSRIASAVGTFASRMFTAK